jgi:L-ribulokinase
MFAATVCGIYANVNEAMNAMGQGFDLHYSPNTGTVDLYQTRYEKFKELGKWVESQVDRSKVEELLPS